MSNDGFPGDGGGSGARSEKARRRYLFTIDGKNAVLPFVCDIVADTASKLEIDDPVTLSEQTPPDIPGPCLEADRDTARFEPRAMKLCLEPIGADQVVHAGHRRKSRVQNLIEENNFSALITETQTHTN